MRGGCTVALAPRATALCLCRMDSEFFPTLHAKRDAARLMAQTAERARVANSADEGTSATSADVGGKQTAAEGAALRAKLGIDTPLRYYPRDGSGNAFSHRVSAVLEAEARMRRYRSPVWLTADEVKRTGRVPLEPGVSVAVGVAMRLLPLEAITDGDARHFLADNRLPKRKSGVDHTFVATFDGRPYDRPWFFVSGKWRQTNRKAINNALVEAAVKRGLPGELWIDEATATGPPHHLELRQAAADGEAMYAAIDVNDGSTTMLFAEDALSPPPAPAA